MAINTSRVAVAGLAAGVVSNIVGFVGFGLLLAERMEAEAVAVGPTLQGRGMDGAAIAINVVLTLVIGVRLVCLYAAMRPPFGPGMSTATLAALAVWICGFVFHIDWLIVGLMTPATYALASVVAFIQVMASAAVGGMLYQE